MMSLLSLGIIVPLFVPFTPQMPAPGLDPSWALGLNQAVAQGLAFGQEILFTLGPYAAIYTKFYHPATDGMMFFGSLYLACSYWFALVLVYRNASWPWSVLGASFLLTMIYAKDSLFFSYPCLVGLVIFQDLQEANLPLSLRRRFILMFLLAPLGLLPLIKGSLVILCGLMLLLCCGLFIFYRQYALVTLACVTLMVSASGFWLYSGQALTSLPLYLSNSLRMALSFSEAMSTPGRSDEVIAYLLVFGLILYLIYRDRLEKPRKLFLLSLFFIFLFLSFKTGFTRHLGHGFIAGTSIGLAALLLPYCLTRKQLLPLSVFIAVFTSFYIDGHYTQINLRNNIYSTYSATWYGLVQRAQNPRWLSDNFQLTMQFLRARSPLPILPGTSDVYSYDQTDLLASGNPWSPRPIFQSYSAFNSYFSRLNQQHLTGKKSPDSIFFKIQPIDNRLPALEDGMSWLALLRHYQPKSLENNWLILGKTQGVQRDFSRKKRVYERHHLRERVVLSKKDRLFWASITLKPTVWGTIAKFLFKSEEVQIHVTTADGVTTTYRFIPSMAQSGFLLSPLIDKNTEFMKLYKKRSDLNARRVISFVIEPMAAERSLFWHSEYDLVLRS